MGFQDKLSETLGDLFEDHGQHKKWRSKNKNSVNQQNKRKRETEKGKDQQYARDAVRRAVEQGKMEKPETCPKCRQKTDSNNMIFDHNKSWSRENALDGSWMCRQCHNKKDNLKPGEGGGHSKQSIRGSKPIAAGFENKYGVVFLEADEDEPTRPEPEDTEGTYKRTRILPITRKRQKSRRRAGARGYNYSLTDNYPSLYFDEHWNRVSNIKDKKHTVHPSELGITLSKGRRVVVDERRAKYFAFSRPNIVDTEGNSEVVKFQDNAFIPFELLVGSAGTRQYKNIRAVIPKHPAETLSKTKIDIETGEVKKIGPRTQIKVKPFEQWRSIGDLGHGREAKPIVSPKSKEPTINPQITALSNDEIEDFLSASKLEMGSPEAMRDPTRVSREKRLAAAYKEQFQEIYMHGNKTLEIHPDVLEAIYQGRFGNDLKEYISKLRKGKGRKDLGASQTTMRKKLEGLQKRIVSDKYNVISKETKGEEKEFVEISKPTKGSKNWEPIWAEPKSANMRKRLGGEATWGWLKGKMPRKLARDVLIDFQRSKKPWRYYAIAPRTMDEHEYQQIQKIIDALHEHAIKHETYGKLKLPKLQPMPYFLIELVEVREEGQGMRGSLKIRLKFREMEKGKVKELVVGPNFPMIRATPIRRETQISRQMKKTRGSHGGRDNPRLRGGPMESILKKELNLIDSLAKIIDKPIERAYSIDAISRQLDD